ncbi:MAG: hypothetical protein JO154_21290 [Chitinophaga sp.]|uniref:hypothetical protein n=1 Tax=Chitinophaga sp. TaxID=1869181 RepID=UPI0025C4F7D4|nr:hypothetical protein [Chitinophaga sp.]MBV8255151.1 hypothetical protein [Chitinophaga sp.]
MKSNICSRHLFIYLGCLVFLAYGCRSKPKEVLILEKEIQVPASLHERLRYAKMVEISDTLNFDGATANIIAELVQDSIAVISGIQLTKIETRNVSINGGIDDQMINMGSDSLISGMISFTRTSLFNGRAITRMFTIDATGKLMKDNQEINSPTCKVEVIPSIGPIVYRFKNSQEFLNARQSPQPILTDRAITYLLQDAGLKEFYSKFSSIERQSYRNYFDILDRINSKYVNDTSNHTSYQILAMELKDATPGFTVGANIYQEQLDKGLTELTNLIKTICIPIVPPIKRSMLSE